MSFVLESGCVCVGAGLSAATPARTAHQYQEYFCSSMMQCVGDEIYLCNDVHTYVGVCIPPIFIRCIDNLNHHLVINKSIEVFSNCKLQSSTKRVLIILRVYFRICGLWSIHTYFVQMV